LIINWSAEFSDSRWKN